MKALKISLVTVVVAAIAFFIIRSIIGDVDHTGGNGIDPVDQFSKRIEQEIDSLKKIPDNKFCKDFYQTVNYHIDDYYKKRRLGKDSLDNEQRRVNYTSNLYSAYAEKFISQAFYVFGRSEWRYEDLSFISTEYKTLQSSSFLEKDSPVDKKFTEIKTILSKYNEIAGFISSSEKFRFSGTRIDDRFPISEVRDKISQAASYRKTGLGNEYVNKCTRLHNSLDSIPKALFREHVRYLDNKINYWSNKYQSPRFNSHTDYVNNLNTPLKNEIETINNIYNVDNFEFQRRRLTTKWSEDNEKAYNYWSRRK